MTEEMTNEEWSALIEQTYNSVTENMQDKYLRMMFSLNMICEFCKRDPDLNMGNLHSLALFGLGFSHEESEPTDV